MPARDLSLFEVIFYATLGSLMAAGCWWAAQKILNWLFGRVIFHHSPRALHWLWANWRGYFWIPCESCGRYFGGHEGGGRIYLGGGTFQTTCWRCPEETGTELMRLEEAALLSEGALNYLNNEPLEGQENP